MSTPLRLCNTLLVTASLLILPLSIINANDVENDTPPSSPCRLYLADSSIPNSGLGIYSGIQVPKGAISTEFDIPIQISDYKVHHPEDKEWLPSHYWWEGSTTDAYHMGNDVDTLIPSFGMLANSHLGLINVQMKLDDDDDLVRLDRSKDPGAGAVSDFHTMTWRASKDIQAGEEIFVNYGENYFMHREEDWNVTISTMDDFRIADDISKDFADALTNDPECNCDLNSQTTQKLWEVIRKIVKPRVKAALPQKAKNLDKVLERGSAAFPLKDQFRSIEWLQENGICLDNLHAKTSMVPGAGRGAFATRFIGAGQLVAPVPVVQLNKTGLDMFELIHQPTPTKYPTKKDDKVVGKQLLYNYCFSHPDTDIALFPYSVAVQFINHKSEGYNAELRWSKSKYHRSEWLNISVGELVNESHTGLMFDIVATRDILQGEEVFIDYGKDWEDAWNKHVEEWEPTKDAELFVHPEDYGKDLTKPFRTIEKQKSKPYPINIRTGCYYFLPDLDIDWDEEREEAKKNGTNILNIDWYYDGKYEMEYVRPCDILKRKVSEEHKYVYDVQMYNTGATEGANIIPADEKHIVHDIPHEAIRFIEKMYSNDQFLENAFRHTIQIPDELLPLVWRNDGELLSE